jgi:hypothetical protein
MPRHGDTSRRWVGPDVIAPCDGRQRYDERRMDATGTPLDAEIARHDGGRMREERFVLPLNACRLADHMSHLSIKSLRAILLRRFDGKARAERR